MKHKVLSNFSLVKSLSFAKIYLNPTEDIVLMQYHPNTTVTLDNGKQMAEAVYPLVNNGAILGLTDATAKDIHVTNEARRYFGHNKSMNATIYHAIALKDLHLRIIANIFLKFDNPSTPVKVFNDLSKAEQFLQKHLEANQTQTI